MEIVLKRISLLNFKGVKNESFDFTERETFIHGANGTGKTSLFDAFIWVNFGKDHEGRSDYQLKTYDSTGKTKDKAKCEVEELLLIDGKETLLKRVYAENWVKPKGEPEEIFKGNETSYYINDVLVKKSEYDAFVSNLCDEIVFKSITNPSYFPNLSKVKQRAILFSMAGEISNESIAEGNNSYQELLREITGVSFDSFRKELLAKKRKLKDEIQGLDPRIDELKRSMPEIPNIVELNKELLEKQKEIEGIDLSINDISKRSQDANYKRLEIQQQINALEQENQKLGFDEQQKQNNDIQTVKTKIADHDRKVTDSLNAETLRKQLISDLIKEQEEKTSIRTSLLKEYSEINAETLNFPEGSFVCPSCKRLLESDNIEEKQAELTANFNNIKADKIAKNKEKGLKIKARLTEIEAELKNLEEPANKVMFGNDVKNLLLKELDKVSVPLVRSKEQIANDEKIVLLKNQLNVPQEVQSTNEYLQKKSLVQSEIDSIKKKLALEDVVSNTNLRITQLEGQFKTLNQELAGIELKEFTLKEFEFAKNTEYEARINKMFEFTRFKLFETQVDGQIVPTCECMVNGVPYSTLNNAMQYGAGLDIINTISRFNNKFAPIWIDNREGITEIPLMKSQVINLVVNKKFKTLKIMQ